jgi:hypothetical protein
MTAENHKIMESIANVFGALPAPQQEIPSISG